MHNIKTGQIYSPHPLEQVISALPPINEEALKKIAGWNYYRRSKLHKAFFSKKYLNGEAVDEEGEALISDAINDTAKWYRGNADLMELFQKRRSKERQLENDPPIHCERCKPLRIEDEVEVLPAFWEPPDWIDLRRAAKLPDPEEPLTPPKYFQSYGQYKVWCRFCERFHLHGPGVCPKQGGGNGHREAHCSYSGSKYKNGGYSLEYVGELTKKIASQHSEKNTRKSNSDGESESWVHFDGHWHLWRTVYASFEHELTRNLNEEDFFDKRDYLTEYAKRHVLYFGKLFRPKGQSRY